MKKKTGPPAVTVEDADKLKSLEADAEVVVVGYFKALEVGAGASTSGIWGLQREDSL